VLSAANSSSTSTARCVWYPHSCDAVTLRHRPRVVPQGCDAVASLPPLCLCCLCPIGASLALALLCVQDSTGGCVLMELVARLQPPAVAATVKTENPASQAGFAEVLAGAIAEM
jgi:hypothetical protein